MKLELADKLLSKVDFQKIANIAKISIAVVVVVIFVWWLQRRIGGVIRNRRLVNASNAEIDPRQITLTNAQFNVLASKIYTAVRGWTTQQRAVFEAFEQLNTRSDVLQLQVVFGVRNNRTMAQWIQRALTRRQVNHLNQIIASRNIDFSFFSGSQTTDNQNGNG